MGPCGSSTTFFKLGASLMQNKWLLAPLSPFAIADCKLLVGGR